MKNFLIDIKDSFKTLKWYEWCMSIIMVLIAAYSMIDSIIHPTESSNPVWLAAINFISAICGIVCIFFCAKANISNFAFGLINTVVYIVYLAYWKIYGTMCLEIFIYFPTNIVSWIFWNKHRSELDRKITKSKRLNIWQNILVILVICLSAVVYHAILVKIGGNVVWLDAFTVAIGIIATMLEMFRYREQYAWWIITDIIAVAMYIQHFDPVYLTKKSIYLIMAIIGFINWIKLNKNENTINE